MASAIADHASSRTSGGWGLRRALVGGETSLTKRVNSSTDSHSKSTFNSSTSTSENPPNSRRPPIASGVGRDIGPGVPGGGGGTFSRSITVLIGTARNGTRSGGPQELIAILAPGFRKPWTRAAAASASGSKMIPQRERAASKLPAGQSSDDASASTN